MVDSVSGGNGLDSLYWQKEQVKVAEQDNGMLTQEDFFALLTKELSYQDPTKPVENNEMISQMTAFSTTDGVAELNEQFTAFASSMSSSQALQASTLVGQSVLVDDNVFGMKEGEGAKGKLATDLPAKDVMIFVENQNGELVQTVRVGDIPAGTFNFSWDGKTSEGEPAAEGVYRYNIGGMVDGQRTELHATTYRRVDSVTLAGANGIVLNLNGGSSMSLADVVEVSEGE